MLIKWSYSNKNSLDTSKPPFHEPQPLYCIDPDLPPDEEEGEGGDNNFWCHLFAAQSAATALKWVLIKNFKFCRYFSTIAAFVGAGGDHHLKTRSQSHESSQTPPPPPKWDPPQITSLLTAHSANFRHKTVVLARKCPTLVLLLSTYCLLFSCSRDSNMGLKIPF